jgi:ABC-type nitrate/sulfonate/bicarbonate transport system substrate-binding protein
MTWNSELRSADQQLARQLSRRSLLRGGARALAGVALLPAAAELLAACGSSSPSAAATSTSAPGVAATSGSTSTTFPPSLGSMDFQFDWITNIQFGGSFVAQSKDYYKQAGIDVSLVTGGPNVTVNPLIQSGKALVGVSDPVTAQAANAKGAGLVLVGAKYQRSPNSIISLAGAPITTPAELVGKKIGIGATSIPTMQAFMKANNLDYSSIHVVPIEFDPAPLAAGEVQGYFGFISNEAVTLQLEGHPVHVMLLADFGLAQFAENYGVEQSSLSDPTKRAQIKAFLHAEIRGWQDVVANPQPAVDLVVSRYGKALGLDPKQQLLEAQAQNQLVVSTDTQQHGLMWMSPAAIQANLKSLSLTGSVASSSLFDNSLLAEIYNGRTQLTD